MKVIITKTGKVEDVSEGYARNYLLPKGLATLATPEKEHVLLARQKKAAQQEAEQRRIWSSWAEMLSTANVQLSAAANEDGTLFGSVSESAILEALNTQYHLSLRREWVHISSPIKHTGTHDVVVEFPSKTKATFVVIISKQ